MRIHCLRHEPFEGLAAIADWIRLNNHSLTYTHIYFDEPFPSVNEFDMLIIMGGTASVYETDKFSWLKEEKELIRQSINQNKKILGICLGAQLLANVLGSRVYKGLYKEIGWFPINIHHKDVFNLPDLPDELKVFHWHGDTFDLPEGAISIASSEAITNQGFIFGNGIIALQFHIEIDDNQLQMMIHAGSKELTEPGKYIQTASEVLAAKDVLKINHLILFSLLDSLALEKIQSLV
jgi:GMP synthase-like glutamine amidotransferase